MRLIHRKDLDIVKYNVLLEQNTMHKIYNCVWYLDIVSKKNWYCLTDDENTIITPLFITRRFLRKQLYMPWFCQQITILDKNKTEVFQSFLNKWKNKTAICIASEMRLENKKVIEFPNYELSLNDSYESLYNRFSKNCKRNIRKSEKNQLQLIDCENISGFVFKKSENSAHKIPKKQQEILQKLIKQSLEKKVGNLKWVINSSKEIIGGIFYTNYNKRLIYHTGFSTFKGKELCSAFFMMNSLFLKRQNSEITLDFEGSKIESIARFFKGFGAENKPYFYIKS